MADKASRRVRMREVAPFDDDDEETPASPSAPSRLGMPPPPGRPPPPPGRLGGVSSMPPPPPPSFGLPLRAQLKAPGKAREAFTEGVGPPPSKAPRKKRAQAKRKRLRPALAKIRSAQAEGLDSDDSSEDEEEDEAEQQKASIAGQVVSPPSVPPPPPSGEPSTASASSAAKHQEVGFWGSLWKGAQGAMGLVSDFVTAINADSESEEEKEKESEKGKDGEPASPGSTAKAKGAATRPSSQAPLASHRAGTQIENEEEDGDDEDDAYVEYITQFCIYLGVDVSMEPALVTEVDDYLKRPLPDGWIVSVTDDACEYGTGYTYYMHSETGRTQWTRPDEDEFLRYLSTKTKREPKAGSRLFFAALRDRNRRERLAALEEQVDHLGAARPLLRALPEGSAEPPLPLPGAKFAGASEGAFHVVLHGSFPVLNPGVVEAFASYFGLGALSKFGVAELRSLWVAKVAALCPVPAGWEFKFDETSMAAVFVDTSAGTASRHHPMDAFFTGLLERMLVRHRALETVESQRTGKPVSLGSEVAFFLDSEKAMPYWLQYSSSAKPWSGSLPWQTVAASKASGMPPRPPPPPLGPLGPSRPSGGAPGDLREAARAPAPMKPDNLRHTALAKTSDVQPAPPPPPAGPATPKAPPSPKELGLPDSTAAQALQTELPSEPTSPAAPSSVETPSEGSPVRASGPPTPSMMAKDAADSTEASQVQANEDTSATAGETPSASTHVLNQDQQAADKEESMQAEYPPDAPPGDVSPTKAASSELPVLPSHDDEAAEKALAPHWTFKEGKWETHGSRHGSDDEGADVEGASAVGKPALSGKLKGVVARFQAEQAAEGSSGQQKDEADARRSALFEVAEKLRAITPEDDASSIWKLLQELESIPATVELLRQTQLGILTQPFKDHSDKQIRAVAKRVRRNWKDLIQSAAVNADTQEGDAAPQPPAGDSEVASAAHAKLEADAQHSMAPPNAKEPRKSSLAAVGKMMSRAPADKAKPVSSPNAQPSLPPNAPYAAAAAPVATMAPAAASDVLQATVAESKSMRQEADDLIQELQQEVAAPVKQPSMSSDVQVGGTDDADDVFGPTPRETPVENVYARPKTKPAPVKSAVDDADEVFGATPRNTPLEHVAPQMTESGMRRAQPGKPKTGTEDADEVFADVEQKKTAQAAVAAATGSLGAEVHESAPAPPAIAGTHSHSPAAPEPPASVSVPQDAEQTSTLTAPAAAPLPPAQSQNSSISPLPNLPEEAKLAAHAASAPLPPSHDATQTEQRAPVPPPPAPQTLPAPVPPKTGLPDAHNPSPSTSAPGCSPPAEAAATSSTVQVTETMESDHAIQLRGPNHDQLSSIQATQSDTAHLDQTPALPNPHPTAATTDEAPVPPAPMPETLQSDQAPIPPSSNLHTTQNEQTPIPPILQTETQQSNEPAPVPNLNLESEQTGQAPVPPISKNNDPSTSAGGSTQAPAKSHLGEDERQDRAGHSATPSKPPLPKGKPPGAKQEEQHVHPPQTQTDLANQGPSGYPPPRIQPAPKAQQPPAAPVRPPQQQEGGYPCKLGLGSQQPPSRPAPRINAGLPQAATATASRRRRAELVSNLQWLCRLFLETREQLFAAHEGTETEVNCDGLREELDAVRFRRLLEEALTSSDGAAASGPLVRFFRAFGRRVLYGRRRSPYGRHAHDQFVHACGGQGDNRPFVHGSVPRILQLMDRLIEEGRNGGKDAAESFVEDDGEDPWFDEKEDVEEESKASKPPRGLPDWEVLDGILGEPQTINQLHEEADAFLSNASRPTLLRLPSDADRADPSTEVPGSGSFAPRGARPPRGAQGSPVDTAGAEGTADVGHSRRLPAQSPYYSCNPTLLVKLAKAPLSNLDSLVSSLVPGTEITTEGLLMQLGDEELVLFAYAMEQIAEAASKLLVKELEVRDELRSTCMHRREYLQLLDGALSRST